MALEIDGAAVLTAMAKKPETFGMTPTQLNSLALNTLIGRLKDKTTGLETMCAIASAMDKPELRLVLDALPVRDLGALSKRLDSKNKEIKKDDENWLREHITRLAYKEELPAAVPVKTVKPKAAPKPPKEATATPVAKTGAVMASKALKARPLTGAKPAAKSPRKKTVE